MKEETRLRVPTIESALDKLIASGVNICCVVDIGVLTGTQSLTKAFPKAKHHLFEPVDVFFDVIRTAYKDVDYELHRLAVSNASGTAFQVGVSADATGKITHSYVSDKSVHVGNQTSQGVVVECKAVDKVSLDEFFANRGSLEGWLVKIDVDGHELPIIQGGSEMLRGVDVVVVEATMDTLLERASAIVALGFKLVEIVECCYYYGLLSQVDLVLVNLRTIDRLPDLHPWRSKAFSFSRWQTFLPPTPAIE